MNNTKKFYSLYYILGIMIFAGLLFFVSLVAHAQDGAVGPEVNEVKEASNGLLQQQPPAELRVKKASLLDIEGLELEYVIYEASSDKKVYSKTTTETKLPVPEELEPGDYYWQVRGKAEGYKTGGFSVSQSFIITAPFERAIMEGPEEAELFVPLMTARKTFIQTARNIFRKINNAAIKTWQRLLGFLGIKVGVVIVVDTNAPSESDLWGQNAIEDIQKIAQSIGEPGTFSFTKIRFKIGKLPNPLDPTDGVSISIQGNNDSGNYDIPDGTPIASTQISFGAIDDVPLGFSSGDTLSNSYKSSRMFTVTVDVPADLPAGQKFWVVFERSGNFNDCSSEGNDCHYALAKESGNPYPNGEQLNYVNCGNGPDWARADYSCEQIIAGGIVSSGAGILVGSGVDLPGGGVVVVGGGLVGSSDDVDLQLLRPFKAVPRERLERF